MKTNSRKVIIYLSIFIFMLFSVVEGQAIFEQIENSSQISPNSGKNINGFIKRPPLAPTYQFKNSAILQELKFNKKKVLKVNTKK